MGKLVRRVLILLCGAVFLVAVWNIVSILTAYQEEEQLYTQAAEQFVQERKPDAEDKADTAAVSGSGLAPETAEDGDTPPITVDFAGLQAVNPEVVGWIYCPDTAINYPVLQTTDNDYYLHRLYDGTYNSAGSIFVDCNNSAGFADANTILYGHHMKNGSMFAGLQKFADQTYYEEHPVMWLLTPEQDYKILLFSGYTTSADSDAYTIFPLPGQELEDYIAQRVAKSNFVSQVEASGAEKLITLSTCAYSFEDARYVLHGVLVAVEE